MLRTSSSRSSPSLRAKLDRRFGLRVLIRIERDSEFVWFLVHLSSSLFQLMELQASFGTDSRFQVDSRFLESDAEPEDQGSLFSYILGFQWVLKELFTFFNISNFQMKQLQKKMQTNNFLRRKRKV